MHECVKKLLGECGQPRRGGDRIPLQTPDNRWQQSRYSEGLGAYGCLLL